MKEGGRNAERSEKMMTCAKSSSSIIFLLLFLIGAGLIVPEATADDVGHEHDHGDDGDGSGEGARLELPKPEMCTRRKSISNYAVV